MTDYLTTQCGFSPDRAAFITRRISHITTPTKPDSVRHFLKHLVGLTDPQIRTFISIYPPILCADTTKTMEPNLTSLEKTSIFTDVELRDFITLSPRFLQLTSAVERFNYYAELFDGDVKKLNLTFKRNRNLISLNVDNVAPKIAVLENYGLSREAIKTVLSSRYGFLGLSVGSIESLMKKAEEFGFLRGSPMFVIAVVGLHGIKSETTKEKMELYKRLGWSDAELVSAIKKFPYILRLSEENIRAKVSFLVEKVGYSLSDLAFRPGLLGLSLKKRLIPRHRVMEILKSNDLLGRKRSFYSNVCLSEKSFMDKLVLPYKEKLPMLLETYIDACGGELPLEISEI